MLSFLLPFFVVLLVMSKYLATYFRLVNSGFRENNWTNFAEIHKQCVVWDGHGLISFGPLCCHFCCHFCCHDVNFKIWPMLIKPTFGPMLLKLITKVLFGMGTVWFDMTHCVDIYVAMVLGTCTCYRLVNRFVDNMY